MLEEIIRLVNPEDITSCRVLERAGMRYPGTASCFGVGTSGSA